MDWALQKPLRKGQAIGRLLDDGPGDDDLLIERSGPLHVDHGDAPQHAPADRLMDLGGLERLDEAVSLELLLIRLHGEGDIDRQHQREIDPGWAGAAFPFKSNIPPASIRVVIRRGTLSIPSSRSVSASVSSSTP